MLDKLKNVSDKKYRLIAGILYAVLIPITLISFLAMIGKDAVANNISLLTLFISCVLLSMGIFFQQNTVILLGIISQLIAYMLCLVCSISESFFYSFPWASPYQVSTVICTLLLLIAFFKNSLSKLAWYIILFACPICLGITFIYGSLNSSLELTVWILTLCTFKFSLPFKLLIPIDSFFYFLIFIFLIAAFFCLAMLVCKGSVHMSKSAAKKQTVAANTSNTLEELSMLKDLLDSGIITQEEFIEKKKQIIK